MMLFAYDWSRDAIVCFTGLKTPPIVISILDLQEMGWKVDRGGFRRSLPRADKSPLGF